MVKLPKPDNIYDLSKFGYKLSKSQKLRRNSLKKASKKYGSVKVLQRLNLIRNITKKKSTNKKKLSKDVEFMKNNTFKM